MKLLLPYFKENRYKIIVGLLCMIFVDLMQLAVPQIIKTAVDALSTEQFQAKQIGLQCMIIVSLGLLMALLRYSWRILLMGSARTLEKGIRQTLFTHLMRLDMTYFNKVKTGDIMAHATSDINHIRMAFGFGLMVIVDTFLLGGATLAIMIWMHPKLTFIAMIPIPMLVLATRYLGKKMSGYHKDAQESFSFLTELIREKFYGIRIVKAYRFESHASEAVGVSSTDYFSKNLKRAFISAFLKPMMGLFFNISSLIVLFYGGLLVLRQSLSPGELVAFLQYLGILSWPIIAIGWMTNLFQRGRASLLRIQHLLSSDPSVKQSPFAIEMPGPGALKFENVSFSYDGNSRILSGISLSIPSGTTLGITGPPGSGKSSLIQLIPRLYDPETGAITIAHHDISNIRLDQLRDHIALMPQESFLFSGTIRDNILMGKDNDTDKAFLEQIIRACALESTISRLPKHLDTIIGERGITLSGGQKQRIALARTLILKRPVIILDDPISQVDTKTANHIIEHLALMQGSATMIIVSHRISALAGCDNICIMDNGRITHTGNHGTLIKSSDFYQTAYLAQQLKDKTK